MKIIVTTPTSQDYKKFCSAGMNAEACLADRVKLICQDDAGHVAESFMKQDEFDRLGLAYIEQNAKLEHSEVFTGVSRHIVTICARYTPTSVLPSGICAASAGYWRMVESRDPT